ncbi:MAG: hypothetical protein J6X59_04090 [Bacteroidales bacterium]|nr:hypothetical protein [Bacteroidales bacterium]
MSEKLQKDFLEMLNQCQGIVMKVCLCFTDRQPANIDDLYQDIVSELWTSYPGGKPRTGKGRSLQAVHQRHPSGVRDSGRSVDSVAAQPGPLYHPNRFGMAGHLVRVPV